MPTTRAAESLLALTLGAAVVFAAAAPAAGADRVRLAVAKGFAVPMSAAGAPANEYDVNPGSDPTVFCRAGTPLAVGWTGATAPIAGTTVYPARGSSDAYVRLAARRPKAAGRIRPVAVCAAGATVKATVKIALSGSSVSCGGKLTLGLAATESVPYIDTPIVVGPSERNGWDAAAGPRPRPTAICVARSAFRQVTNVRATGALVAGRSTVVVSASCPRGRRVLAWGYQASPIPGNTWRSVESRGTVRSVPFVGAAVPTAGAKGFKVTFRTPDNAPATSAAPVSVSLRCGVPAGS